MTERPCTHVFAPCDGPCTSYVYRAEEIDLTASDDRWDRRVIILAVSVFTAAFLSTAIYAGTANWKAEQHRQISQARV